MTDGPVWGSFFFADLPAEPPTPQHTLQPDSSGSSMTRTGSNAFEAMNASAGSSSGVQSTFDFVQRSPHSGSAVAMDTSVEQSVTMPGLRPGRLRAFWHQFIMEHATLVVPDVAMLCTMDVHTPLHHRFGTDACYVHKPVCLPL